MAERVVIEDDEPRLALLPPEVVPVAVTRRPSAKDHARLHEIERLRRDGMPLLDAVWSVIGEDGLLAYARFRGMPRPSDVTLRGKYSALVCRLFPQLTEQAKKDATATFASAAGDAAQAVVRLARGKIKDAHKSKVQLDAGRTVLESVGVGSKAAPQVQVNVAVGLAAKLRGLDTDAP
jgi:hypothetical protein